MSLRSKLAIVWIAVAILLAAYSHRGGDASIVGGFLFLLWTAPFGMIWQFWIYDSSIKILSPALAQLAGDALAVAFGAAFWFVFVPFIWRIRSRKHSG